MAALRKERSVEHKLGQERRSDPEARGNNDVRGPQADSTPVGSEEAKDTPSGRGPAEWSGAHMISWMQTVADSHQPPPDHGRDPRLRQRFFARAQARKRSRLALW